jgi:hypothetical protein
MNWILLLLLVVAVYVFVKATNKGQNVWSYFLVIAAIFLLISVVYVSTSSDVELGSLDGVIGFSKLYFSWLGGVFSNFASITGNVVNLNWRAINSTR